MTLENAPTEGVFEPGRILDETFEWDVVIF
jgi:hypothetical protein